MTQLLFQGQGEGQARSGLNPCPHHALQLCLGRVTAKLQVGMRGVLCATGKQHGVLRQRVGSEVTEQPLPSSPC